MLSNVPIIRRYSADRSPRWSSAVSDYPRILGALVLEFDSHRRDEILSLFAKMQKNTINC